VRLVFLNIIAALGILNGAIGFVQMYQYLNGDNSRQKLGIVMLNITVFAFSLVYASIRRERLKETRGDMVSASSR
jgi:hypothetical protein